MIVAEDLEWRKIPLVPERFEVSQTGVVRMLPRQVTVPSKSGRYYTRFIEGRYLEPYVHDAGKSRGHPVVSLSFVAGDRAKIGEVRVNLLVARAFHGCPYDAGDLSSASRWRVRHKDGDVMNVCADNLEWIGNAGVASTELYERNLRRLEELRREPVEEWIRRMWGSAC